MMHFWSVANPRLYAVCTVAVEVEVRMKKEQTLLARMPQ